LGSALFGLADCVQAGWKCGDDGRGASPVFAMEVMFDFCSSGKTKSGI